MAACKIFFDSIGFFVFLFSETGIETSGTFTGKASLSEHLIFPGVYIHEPGRQVTFCPDRWMPDPGSPCHAGSHLWVCKASRRTGNWYSRCSQHIRDSISRTHRNREPFQFRTCPGSTRYFRQPPRCLSGNPDSSHINCDPVGPGFSSYFACSNPSPSGGSPSRKHRCPGAVPRIISTSDALRNTGSSQSTAVSFPPLPAPPPVSSPPLQRLQRHPPCPFRALL